jgi:hypothetical protein
MIKLIQIYLTQYLKWYTLHLKLIAIKKDWDKVEKEKFNYLLIPENQFFKDKAITKQVTDIFNLLHQKRFKDKNKCMDTSNYNQIGVI